MTSNDWKVYWALTTEGGTTTPPLMIAFPLQQAEGHVVLRFYAPLCCTFQRKTKPVSATCALRFLVFFLQWRRTRTQMVHNSLSETATVLNPFNPLGPDHTPSFPTLAPPFFPSPPRAPPASPSQKHHIHPTCVPPFRVTTPPATHPRSHPHALQHSPRGFTGLAAWVEHTGSEREAVVGEEALCAALGRGVRNVEWHRL